MIILLVPQDPRVPRYCLPLPAVVTRVSVLIVLVGFVLVLLRWGYDGRTCLALAAALGLLGIQIGDRASRPWVLRPPIA